MPVKITLFGQLTDITGSSAIDVGNASDTDGLVSAVNKLYPSMAGVKYRIAIDKKIITGNTAITDESTIALLPPFSGG